MIRRVVSDTIQWRAIAFGIDFSVFAFVTGEWFLASGLALGLFGTKTILFFLWRVHRERKLSDSL